MSDQPADRPKGARAGAGAAGARSDGGARATSSAPGPAGSVLRRVVVTVSFLVCIIGSMIGVGVFGGTPISEAAGGLLATDATHLAPASPAFSVWTLIYVALGGYTIWQWWDRTDPRRLGWLIAASLLLNAAWILTVQAGWVWVSVVVIVALLAVLSAAFRRLRGSGARGRGAASGPRHAAGAAGQNRADGLAGPRTRLEAAVVDGTVGLYLGWVCVATCANIAAALAGSGLTGGGYPQVWAVAVLILVAIVGVALAVGGRGRLAVAATLVWGLAWIAVARTDEPYAPVTAIAAATAAVVIAVATLVLRLRAPEAGA